MQNAEIAKAIPWNPWHGCKKVSPECKNCFVSKIDQRYGRDTTIIAKGKTTYELKDKDCPPNSQEKYRKCSNVSNMRTSVRSLDLRYIAFRHSTELKKYDDSDNCKSVEKPYSIEADETKRTINLYAIASTKFQFAV